MLKSEEPQLDSIAVDDTLMEVVEETMTLEEKIIKEKQEWVKQFRLKFCVREEFEITKNMIYSDGTLNQE
jgi:hypothetical protein